MQNDPITLCYECMCTSFAESYPLLFTNLSTIQSLNLCFSKPKLDTRKEMCQDLNECFKVGVKIILVHVCVELMLPLGVKLVFFLLNDSGKACQTRKAEQRDSAAEDGWKRHRSVYISISVC